MNSYFQSQLNVSIISNDSAIIKKGYSLLFIRVKFWMIFGAPFWRPEHEWRARCGVRAVDSAYPDKDKFLLHNLTFIYVWRLVFITFAWVNPLTMAYGIGRNIALLAWRINRVEFLWTLNYFIDIIQINYFKRG